MKEWPRLTSETISGATSQNGAINYTYDAVGNSTQLTSTVPIIPSSGLMNYNANDQLATDAYDANGNTVVNASTTNVYDFENHLVRHGNVSIVYDGDGNRVTEAVGGVTTQYLVDTVNPTGYAQVIDELQSGSVTRHYTWGLELIAESQVIHQQWTTSFYGFDGHGSVRFLTNSTGAVTDTYDYDAFGNLLVSTGSTSNNYLFAGEQFDAALGIYYNRARYYDERNGRFWSMDQDEGQDDDPVSLHKYLYANDDPTDLADPSGHDPSDAIESAVESADYFALSIFGQIAGIGPQGAIPAKVEVHFDLLGAMPITHRRFYHAYLLIRDTIGLTLIYRGGPSTDYRGHSEATQDFSHVLPQSKKLRFGYISSAGSGEIFSANSADWPKEPGDDAAMMTVPNPDQPFLTLKREFDTASQRIENLRIPYHPVTQNSNSFIHTLLVKAHLNSPKLPVWAPGWGRILY